MSSIKFGTMDYAETQISINSNKNKRGVFNISKKTLLLIFASSFFICIALLIFLTVIFDDFLNCNKTSIEKSKIIEKRETKFSMVTGKSENQYYDDFNLSNYSCEEVCVTSTCHDEATFFLNNIDESVDPCEDFYNFACGNFIKKTAIPDDENKIDMLRITQNKVMNELIDEIKSEIKPDELSAFKKMKTHYQNCMNESRIEEESVKTLLRTLQNLGGWPVLLRDEWKEKDFSWTETIYKIVKSGYYLSLPATIFLGPDSKNSTINVIKILNADTRVSESFFTLDGSNSTTLKAYYDYMVDIAKMLGANWYDASQEMKKCLDFEINLFRIKSSMDEMMDTTANYNPITIKELSKKHPSIPWLTLINEIVNPSGVTVNEDEIVILNDPKFIARLEILIARTPKRVIANYLAWQVVYESVDYLPENYLNRQLTLFQYTRGIKERKSRAYSCVDDIMLSFPLSLSALYVRKHFNVELKRSVMDLVQNVKKEFRKMLIEVDWMDQKTKLAAVEKLDAMDVFVAYSDELFDDKKVDDFHKDLELNSGNYLEGAFNVSHFFTKKYFGNLRKPVDKNDWTSHKNAAVINAYYYIQKNTFEIPAGFLRGSFFHMNRPKYLNYGAIGSIIGHEITHGFDNEGRKTDKNGNQVDWWQPQTTEKYLQKAKCIIDQYKNYVMTVDGTNFKLNGERSQGENIADNGGFKAAYRAYLEWTHSNNISEACLPGLNYTSHQMFWISAANNWCSKQKPETLIAMIRNDAHSPPTARVTIPLSNIKEFSKDFKCKVGSKMNLAEKCVVW